MRNAKVLSIFLLSGSCLVYSIAQVIKTDRFYRTAEQRMPHIISQHFTVSPIKCCDMCLVYKDCQSVNYNNLTGSCQLVPQSMLAVSPLAIVDSSWRIYSKREWLLVFVGLAGNGVDVHASYISGTGAVTDDVNCMTLNMAACQQNNRSPVMDSWSSLSITEVKYSLYKNDQEAAYAIFNGTGSDVTNWFIQARLSQSTWATALTTPSFNYFGIDGHSPSRRFFMSVLYNGCPGDLIFTVTITASVYSCNFDTQPAYPQFIYSTTTTASYIGTGVDTEYADYMAVYIR